MLPEPVTDQCPVVLGAHRCARRAGHTTFHLCVPAARALELMEAEESERALHEPWIWGPR